MTQNKPNPSGFNDSLRDICSKKCAECGDPPCWQLPDLVEPCEHITPCPECMLADLEGRGFYDTE